jgi:hypothetical protein
MGSIDYSPQSPMFVSTPDLIRIDQTQNSSQMDLEQMKQTMDISDIN